MSRHAGHVDNSSIRSLSQEWQHFLGKVDGGTKINIQRWFRLLLKGRWIGTFKGNGGIIHQDVTLCQTCLACNCKKSVMTLVISKSQWCIGYMDIVLMEETWKFPVPPLVLVMHPGMRESRLETSPKDPTEAQ